MEVVGRRARMATRFTAEQHGPSNLAGTVEHWGRETGAGETRFWLLPVPSPNSKWPRVSSAVATSLLGLPTKQEAGTRGPYAYTWYLGCTLYPDTQDAVQHETHDSAISGHAQLLDPRRPGGTPEPGARRCHGYQSPTALRPRFNFSGESNLGA